MVSFTALRFVWEGLLGLTFFKRPLGAHAPSITPERFGDESHGPSRAIEVTSSNLFHTQAKQNEANALSAKAMVTGVHVRMRVGEGRGAIVCVDPTANCSSSITDCNDTVGLSSRFLFNGNILYILYK